MTFMDEIDDDERFTPAEAAAKLHISVNQVYKLLREEDLGHFQIGRKKVIPGRSLKAFDQRTWVPRKEPVATGRTNLRAV
jgi:excisionase family DNA binding protein